MDEPKKETNSNKWDSVLSIVSVLWTGWWRNHGLFLRRSKRFLSFPRHPDWLWAHCLVFKAYRDLGVKWPEHKTDHSPLSSAEVNA